jgi:chitin synthase
MNRHPPSNYGDEPPAYLDHETASFLSDHESPTNASRHGATMRLLPTSGDGADDFSSPRAASPSAYDPDYDHTPYVSSALFLTQPYTYPHSSGFPRYGETCTFNLNSFLDVTEAGKHLGPGAMAA